MSTPILRGLAKAYSENLIDRKEYITERRHLIDDIVAGNVDIVPYEAPSLARDPDNERTFSDGESTLELPRVDSEAESKPITPAKSNKGLAMFLIVATVAIAAFAGWRFISQGEPPSVTSARPEPFAEGPNPAGVLLEIFLEENDWREERIDGFMLAWESESESARQGLRNSATMRRAADQLTQQILEEKALFELGEREDALLKQRRLLDLAGTLGIRNERIARQEKEWQANSTALKAETVLVVEADPDPAVTEATETVISTAESADASEAATSAAPTADEPVDQAVSVEEQANIPSLPLSAESSADPATDPGSTASAAGMPATADPPPAVEAADAQDTANSLQPPTESVTPVAGPPVAAQASKPSSAKRSACRSELAQKRRPYCRDTLGENGPGPTLVVLPAGEIEIGGSKPEEQPKFTVRIARPFGLGVYEISVDEFNTFCRATQRSCPAQPWADPTYPVVNIAWSLADDYTKWLSEMSGATYRLPTESEWEYAARAGTTTPYPFGDEVLPTHARFSFRGTESTPVATDDRTVNRNKFRLYHMIGNVREWVLDRWNDTHAGAPTDGTARTGNSDERVARGGAYDDGADGVRSASRVHLAANSGDARTGFRVLREID